MASYIQVCFDTHIHTVVLCCTELCGDIQGVLWYTLGFGYTQRWLECTYCNIGEMGIGNWKLV